MLSDRLLGRVLDNRYRIDAEIGAGGMATIYRATRLQIGDIVAIKILHSEFLREPKFVERFQREAQAAARLKHPNVVSIYDFGVCDDGVIYLVMELVEGRNLRTVIKDEGPMPATRAAEIGRQVCAALAEAHRQNVIHRDIKPANIAVEESSDGLRVRVLDFGIASLRGGTMMTFTQTGAVLGTPAYMSPEQCLGEELDGRSDIYSLGVVLFEMLCGIVPFNSPTATAVVMQHVQQAPPPLRVLNVSISPAMEAVVFRALSKRREDRQQSAKQLGDELSAAALGTNAPFDAGGPRGFAEPLSARQAAFTMVQSPFHPQPPTAAPARGGRTTGVIIALAATAVLVALGFGAQRMWSARTPATHAARPTATAVVERYVSLRSGRTVPLTPDRGWSPSADFVVRQYYSLWDAHRLPEAYLLLSNRYRAEHPYSTWASSHDSVVHISVQTGDVGEPMTVAVAIQSVDRTPSGTEYSDYRGTWKAVHENGTTKLDEVSLNRVR